MVREELHMRLMLSIAIAIVLAAAGGCEGRVVLDDGAYAVRYGYWQVYSADGRGLIPRPISKAGVGGGGPHESVDSLRIFDRGIEAVIRHGDGTSTWIEYFDRSGKFLGSERPVGFQSWRLERVLER
jgi:hypothetical protein